MKKLLSRFLTGAVLLGATVLAVPSLAQNVNITGTFTNGGLVGVTSNTNACTGCIGEYQSSSITSGVAAVSATAATVTSLALTAGDWDCRGNVILSGSNTGQGTTVFSAWTSTTSLTAPTINGVSGQTGGSFAGIQMPSTILTQPYGLSLAPARYSFSSTTTVFLGAQDTFSGGGSSTLQGFLGCRRVQ